MRGKVRPSKAWALALPTDPTERQVFVSSYADYFTGDNHESAVGFARFSVFYLKGMKLGPWAEGPELPPPPPAPERPKLRLVPRGCE